MTIDLLRKFTVPGDARLGEVHLVKRYRGDLTETEAHRARAALGDEQYSHLHWDTAATNGEVLVIVPRWKLNAAADVARNLLRAEYYWAMEQMEEPSPDDKCGIRPCKRAEIDQVSEDARELIAELPEVEYMMVRRVSFYSTNRRGKLWKQAPRDVRYFRFAAGYGLVAIEGESTTRKG